MSILQGAASAVPEPVIVTICGMPGSGKSSLAATFPKPFMIRTQGEAVPRDLPNDLRPVELGETDTEERLWQQLKALALDEHDFKTLIIDSVTGLETLFVEEVVKSDDKPNKNKSIKTVHGGYGAGRDLVTAKHNRVRRAAEALRKRGMNVVFLAHSDITRLDPPDTESYTQYSLRLHEKSMSPYVDSVDVVGFIKQYTVVRGEEGERKRAIGDGERILVTYMTPTAITKNRLGLTEDIELQKGANPFEQFMTQPPAKSKRVPAAAAAAAASTPANKTQKDENDG